MTRHAKRWALVAALAALAAATAIAGARGEDARASTPLVRGWNNVAYLGEAKPPSEALSSLGNSYSAIYRWNTATQKYDLFAPDAPAYANTLTQLNPGDAIWLNLNAESGSLPFSLNAGGTNSSAPASGKGKIAIAASTFVPASDLAIYEKSFNQLNPVGTDEASKRYFAPVILPDGVSITTMTAHYEANGGDVQVRLDYTPLSNGNAPAQIFKLVEVLSSAGASPQTVNAFAHTVDNGANVYFLVVDLTGGSGTKLRGISIAYSY